MRTFDYTSYRTKSWDTEIVNCLSAIHEARGKQTYYLRQKGETLNRLTEIAKIQSTESSNAIEGIRTTETRLRQLIAEKTAPRNRDEREILGYRDALNAVHESFEYIPLTPNYILQLHKIMFRYTGSSFGGQYKNVQNYITASDSSGKRYILFQPPAPYETAPAVQAACDAYNLAVGEGVVDPLLLIPLFIHDFLCIHPFLDGNGRMSRLLTTLLLYRSGYTVGKYISLEAKIAETRDGYYEALEKSQHGWREGKDDPTEFIRYILKIILEAYRDLEDRMEILEGKKNALEIVREAVRQQIGLFRKKDILERCPSLSTASVERSLRAMCEGGEIEKQGSGRATSYVRKTI